MPRTMWLRQAAGPRGNSPIKRGTGAAGWLVVVQDDREKLGAESDARDERTDAELAVCDAVGRGSEG